MDRNKQHPNWDGHEIDERDSDPTVHEQRVAFLHAASEHPEIRLADALRNEVYRHVIRLEDPVLGIQDVANVDRLIWDWARRFNLETYWVIGMVSTALCLWSIKPDREYPFRWQVLYEPPPQFDWPEWYQSEEREPEYRTRVDAAFSRALESYITASKAKRSALASERADVLGGNVLRESEVLQPVILGAWIWPDHGIKCRSNESGLPIVFVPLRN